LVYKVPIFCSVFYTLDPNPDYLSWSSAFADDYSAGQALSFSYTRIQLRILGSLSAGDYKSWALYASIQIDHWSI
jgi:hypothetical protein